MSGLTLARLRRIRLPARPVLQRVAACLLVWPNYRFLPGVEVIFEDLPALPAGPVLVAMNHTYRVDYFPFMFRWWREKGRFCSAWMKGKYYENPILGAVMERMGTIPTVSRGYLVVRDFRDVTGRVPDDAEYRHLRTWVEGGAGLTRLESDALRPPPGSVPDAVLTRPRDILGRRFDPSRESYAEAMSGLSLPHDGTVRRAPRGEPRRRPRPPRLPPGNPQRTVDAGTARYRSGGASLPAAHPAGGLQRL